MDKTSTSASISIGSFDISKIVMGRAVVVFIKPSCCVAHENHTQSPVL